jgi:hypothetical protein
MTICHSVGVATHESRDALQHDKRARQIGLKNNNVWYKLKQNANPGLRIGIFI